MQGFFFFNYFILQQQGGAESSSKSQRACKLLEEALRLNLKILGNRLDWGAKFEL